jgi:Flp pilus assembly pilin Flp
MRAKHSISDRLLYWQVAAVNGARTGVQRGVERARNLVKDEKGQTPTEYLMIVGLMAAVIVAVFVIAFWPVVKKAAATWTDKVRETVLGEKIK